MASFTLFWKLIQNFHTALHCLRLNLLKPLWSKFRWPKPVHPQPFFVQHQLKFFCFESWLISEVGLKSWNSSTNSNKSLNTFIWENPTLELQWSTLCLLVPNSWETTKFKHRGSFFLVWMHGFEFWWPISTFNKHFFVWFY